MKCGLQVSIIEDVCVRAKLLDIQLKLKEGKAYTPFLLLDRLAFTNTKLTKTGSHTTMCSSSFHTFCDAIDLDQNWQLLGSMLHILGMLFAFCITSRISSP